MEVIGVETVVRTENGSWATVTQQCVKEAPKSEMMHLLDMLNISTGPLLLGKQEHVINESCMYRPVHCLRACTVSCAVRHCGLAFLIRIIPASVVAPYVSSKCTTRKTLKRGVLYPTGQSMCSTV